MSDERKVITLTIDGKTVLAAPGTNLIEAARSVGIEIPYYCWHEHLSIAGNCRMCQVEIEGANKLTIACNTTVREGMVVHTHKTSEAVAEAQRATLEFLLINHPLDCTVCDAAGHCKLQDYYYQYDAKGSRFTEEKVHKVKAQAFGPEVIYDGERCILCTRCVRFCNEVTKTSELAILNRGDHSVIGLAEGKELANPLAGTVNDLCPVGALTHRRWRFNTRIWFATQEDSICPGCSTGCNVRVAVRDNQIMYVKGRLNTEVNQEWLCNEGRYGFHRFQPKTRLSCAMVREGFYLREIRNSEAYEHAAKACASEATAQETAVFLSPFLTLEEQWVSLEFVREVLGVDPSLCVAMQLKRRELSATESILISPDYAPNALAITLFGLGKRNGDWRTALEHRYLDLVQRVRTGQAKKCLLIGDYSLLDGELDQEVVQAILSLPASVSLGTHLPIGSEERLEMDSFSASQLCLVLLPGRTVNEKSGIMINGGGRLQKLARLLTPPSGSVPEWLLLKKIAQIAGKALFPPEIGDERSLFIEMTKRNKLFEGITLSSIGLLGQMVETEEELASS